MKPLKAEFLEEKHCLGGMFPLTVSFETLIRGSQSYPTFDNTGDLL
jgi:hypothetical protein